MAKIYIIEVRDYHCTKCNSNSKAPSSEKRPPGTKVTTLCKSCNSYELHLIVFSNPVFNRE